MSSMSSMPNFLETGMDLPVSSKPPSTDDAQANDFSERSQKTGTQIGDTEMEELFESAKAGSVDDFVSLIRNLREDKNESAETSTLPHFPPSEISKAFDLFVSHIRKRWIRGDAAQLTLAANSLTGLEILWEHRSALWISQSDGKRDHLDWKFAILWTDIFHWLEVLEEALFNRDIDEETAIDAITNTFVLFRDLDSIHTKPIFNDPDVFKLAYRLWLRDLAADEGRYTLWSEPLAIVCTKQMDFDDDNAPFLDAALEVFQDYGEPKADGKNGGIARIAIRRLVAFLDKGTYAGRVGRVVDAVTMLWLIAKDSDPYGNKEELSSNPQGLPSVVRALNVIASATFEWNDQMDAIHRGLDLLQTQVIVDVLNDGVAITDRMTILLQSGILTTIVNIRRRCAEAPQGHEDSEECMLLILLTIKNLLAKPHTAALISTAAREDVQKLVLTVTGDVKGTPVTVEALLWYITTAVLGDSPAIPPLSSQDNNGKECL